MPKRRSFNINEWSEPLVVTGAVNQQDAEEIAWRDYGMQKDDVVFIGTDADLKHVDAHTWRGPIFVDDEMVSSEALARAGFNVIK